MPLHPKRFAGISIAVAAAVAALAAPAMAAPPPNDARASAQAISLPAVVRGSTAEATMEEGEPPALCAPIKNSVWFSFRAPARRQLLVALDAAGDMDATVELFVRQRSQLIPAACQATNRRGEATLDADVTEATDYLVRVAPLANSVTQSFTLRVVLPDEPARPPGQRLPAAGTSGQVDRFANPDDAWSTLMREGRTYRINLVTVGQGCARITLYRADAFGRDAEASLACDDHTVFSAPETGRYTMHVQAPRASRAQLPYRLRVGPAERDDSAPGIVLPDDDRVGGSLRGDELDALDLYRFTVARRSDLRVRLTTTQAFDLRLLSEGGRQLACACRFAGSKEWTRRVSPGRYFVAVRARDGAHGRYVLSRLARTITRSAMLVNGRRRATVGPAQSVTLGLRVTPPVPGGATMVVERYDPLAGWLFHSRHEPRVSGTEARVAFRPPFVGRWRVTGSYDGTRTASPSTGGVARFHVVEPLDG